MFASIIQEGSFGAFVVDAGAIAAALAAIAAVVVAIVKYAVVRPLKHFMTDLINEKTKSIQPDANGGKSLADVARIAREVRDRLDEHDTHLSDLRVMMVARESERAQIFQTMSENTDVVWGALRQLGAEVPDPVWPGPAPKSVVKPTYKKVRKPSE